MYEDVDGPKDCYPTCKTCFAATAQSCLTCYTNADLSANKECLCIDGTFRISTMTIALGECE